MADDDSSAPAPDPDTLPPPAPLYIGPDPTVMGGHQVLTADGQTQTVPFEGLTPSLQNDAIQAAQPQPTAAEQDIAKFQNLPPGTPTPPDTQAAEVAADVAPPQPVPAPQPVAATPAPVAQTADQMFGAQKPAGGGGGGGATPDPGDAGLAQSAADKLAAANTGYQLSKQTSAEQLALGQKNAAEEASRLADQQVKEAANQRQQQDMLARAQATTNDFLNQKVDPNHYWNSMSTGGKIASAAAMIVSGFGAGLTGKDNLAVKAFDDAQNADLAAQKYNIEHKKDASEQYSKLFQGYQAAGLDQRQSFAATELAIKQKNLQDVDNMMLQHGGQKSLLDFQNQTAGIREDIATKASALRQQGAATNQSKAATAADYANAAKTRAETGQLGVAAGNARDIKAAQANLSAGHAFRQLPPEQQRALVQQAQASKMLVPGEGIAQREVTPEEHTQLQGVRTVQSELGDLDRLVNNGIPTPAARRQAAEKAEAIQALLPNALGTKARLSEGTQEVLNSMIKDPGYDILGHHKDLSKALRSTLGKVKSSLHKDLGLTPFDPVQFTPST